MTEPIRRVGSVLRCLPSPMLLFSRTAPAANRGFRWVLLGLVFLVAGSGSGTACPSLPRAAPESQGVSSVDLLAFIETAEARIQSLHSFMLLRHGTVVAEGWWQPYRRDEPHMLFSLSKSVTSAAVGLAVSEGRLRLDDPILSFFPNEAPVEPSINLKAMRVSDLLMMSTGQHQVEIVAFDYSSSASLVRNFLALPVAHKPGTHFVYNTPGSYMLAAIVEKVTGQRLVDYLKPRLFDPLGIRMPSWEVSPQGVAYGGFGLSLRTEDIARFGQLHLQKGRWNGRTLLPESWVTAATARQTANGSNPESDWEQGYGYQFWRCRHGFYRGDGAHGQYCIVLPEFDAVIAVTSGVRDMAAILSLVWERLLPALRPGLLPADSHAERRLAAKLGSLALPAPAAGQPSASVVAGQAGRRHAFVISPRIENPVAPPRLQPLEWLELEKPIPGMESAPLALRLRINGREGRVELSGRWMRLAESPPGDLWSTAVCGGWEGGDTLRLNVACDRAPYTWRYRIHFGTGGVEADMESQFGANAGKAVRLDPMGTAVAPAAKPPIGRGAGPASAGQSQL